jgi:hypothetical protein
MVTEALSLVAVWSAGALAVLLVAFSVLLLLLLPKIP